MKILVVEDDPDMSRALIRALDKRGFEVLGCHDGLAAFQLIKKKEFEIIILDLNIPGEDGLHLLQRMRNGGIVTPVLILTARSSIGDRIAGLNAGGDDYLSKPFDLDELEARIKALWRRSRGYEDAELRCGNLSHDFETGAFYVGSEPLVLPRREQMMLKALFVRHGRAISKEQLFRMVFSDDDSTSIDAVEVVAHRLRKKLSGTRTVLVTLRGLGYLLREDREEKTSLAPG